MTVAKKLTVVGAEPKLFTCWTPQLRWNPYRLQADGLQDLGTETQIASNANVDGLMGPFHWQNPQSKQPTDYLATNSLATNSPAAAAAANPFGQTVQPMGFPDLAECETAAD